MEPGTRVRINETYGDGAYNDKYYHYQTGTVIAFDPDLQYQLVVFLDEQPREDCFRRLEYVMESEVDILED